MQETYEVRIQARFSAVHQLRLQDGSLEPLHGHDWRVEAVFRGPRLDETELLIDFETASRALREVVAVLDQADLNRLAIFEARNPSAEVVARLIYQQLRERLGREAPLAAVYVEEAPGCIAGYAQASS